MTTDHLVGLGFIVVAAGALALGAIAFWLGTGRSRPGAALAGAWLGFTLLFGGLAAAAKVVTTTPGAWLALGAAALLAVPATFFAARTFGRVANDEAQTLRELAGRPDLVDLCRMNPTFLEQFEREPDLLPEDSWKRLYDAGLTMRTGPVAARGRKRR